MKTASDYPNLDSELSLKEILECNINYNTPIEHQHHLKFLWHQDRLNNFLKGNIYDIKPITAEIVPSLDCNYGCKHCTYNSWKSNTDNFKGNRKSNLESIKLYLDEIHDFDIKGVIFTGGGEPFMNKNTPKGIEYASELGLDIGAFTNGSLLNEEIINQIYDKLNFLRISLNAGSEEVYNEFHNIKNLSIFEKVKSNIETMAEYASNSDINFGLGVIVNEINVDDLNNIKELVLDVAYKYPNGLSYVGFRPVIDYKNPMNQISKNVLDKVILVKDEITQELNSEYVNSFWAFDYFKDAVNTVDTGKKEYSKCLANPWAVSVAYDGGVYLCSENNGNEKYKLGDLNKQSLPEIWNCDKHYNIINSIGNCKSPTCKLHRLNKILNNWDSLNFGGNNPLLQKDIEYVSEYISELKSKGRPGGINFI